MRILVLSDIHGNLEALEACLAAAPAYDRVYNLGDIVGYGASPNQVVEQSCKLDGLVVRGNHDKVVAGLVDASNFNLHAALAAHWTQRELTPENIAWLRALPPGPVKADGDDGIQCVHGSPLDEDEYIVVIRDAYQPMMQSQTPLTFFGHTHIQGGFAMNGGEYSTLRPIYSAKDEAESYELQLAKTATYLINPGAVGQPRDGDWRAAFALYDTETRAVTFHRVPYNVNTAQKKIYAAGLPERLALRLSEGR